MSNIVIFCRVSTFAQDYERQINELTTLADRNGWTIRGVFAEKVSGARKNCSRQELNKMLDFIGSEQIDKVLVTELSRLGRNTLQVLEVIENLNKMGVSLYIQNYNIETLDAKGCINPMSQFMITMLAEIARMERKSIKERMDSGYNNFRNNGGKVGRKNGYRKTDDIMREQYGDAIKLLRKGISLRNISKLCNISVNTVRKCKALV